MMVRRGVCLAFALLAAACCAVSVVSASYVRQSLDGSDWTLRNSNGSISVPATVPGVVHLDLIAAAVIGDPYYRYNERELRWIVYEPFWSEQSTVAASTGEPQSRCESPAAAD
jgi:beta-mannosidase